MEWQFENTFPVSFPKNANELPELEYRPFSRSGHWPAVSSGTVYLGICIWFFALCFGPFICATRAAKGTRRTHMAQIGRGLRLLSNWPKSYILQLPFLAPLGPLTQFPASHITSIWSPVLITDSEVPINNVQHTNNTWYMRTHLNAFWISNVPKMENGPRELCNIPYPGVAIGLQDNLFAVWVLCNWKLNGKC